jgi:hypothetical protein
MVRAIDMNEGKAPGEQQEKIANRGWKTAAPAGRSL